MNTFIKVTIHNSNKKFLIPIKNIISIEDFGEFNKGKFMIRGSCIWYLHLDVKCFLNVSETLDQIEEQLNF